MDDRGGFPIELKTSDGNSKVPTAKNGRRIASDQTDTRAVICEGRGDERVDQQAELEESCRIDSFEWY